MKRTRQWLGPRTMRWIALVVVIVVGSSRVVAQDASLEPPSDAAAAELLEYLQKLPDQLLADLPKDAEQRRARLDQYWGLVRQASEQILAGEASERQQRAAISYLLSALQGQAQSGDEVAGSIKKVVDGVIAGFDQTPPTILDANLLFQAASALEAVADEPFAGAEAERIVSVLKRSDDQDVREASARIEGLSRRLNSLGGAFDFSGAMLDGEPITAEQFEGKVVLIDFWATWCTACVEELPNLKKLHDEYHDQGFEVLGVCLDDDPEASAAFIRQRKLPWKQIDVGGRPGDHVLAERYGVMALPVVLLLDQQGRVVSLQARGETLEKKLQKLFAPRESVAAGN